MAAPPPSPSPGTPLSPPAAPTASISKKLEKKGARFGLQYDMFRSIQAILDAGRLQDPDAAPGTYSSWETKLHELYDKLLAIAPELRDELTIRGPANSLELAEMIEKGRVRDRNNNINGCKVAIRDWMLFEPPLPIEKQFRGYNCESSGRLLCPVVYDYTDPNVRVALLEYQCDYPAGADDYPALLWRDGRADKMNFFKGFGEGCLICKALQHILVAPSLAKSTDGVTSRSNRKGRARIHGITKVTPAMIAYAACMVHFALSSQATFGAGSSEDLTKFWYEGFYNSLIRTMEDVMPDDRKTQLLIFHSMKLWTASREAAQAASNARRVNPSVATYMATQATLAASMAGPSAA